MFFVRTRNRNLCVSLGRVNRLYHYLMNNYMNTEEILEELANYLATNWQQMEGGEIIDIDPIEWLRTHLTARYEQGRRDAREGNIKTVRNSRTLNEAYGIGKAEDAARTQVIVDIISAKE